MDYVARIISAPHLLKWMIKPLNIVDLLAIVPFYVEVGIKVSGGGKGSALASLAVIKVFRLLRVFRLFKLSRYSVSLSVIGSTLKKSSEGFALLGLTLSMVVVIFSSALFFAEQTSSNFDKVRQLWFYETGTKSSFQSVASAMWWCIQTISTCGYGDIVPISTLGKVIACLAMLTGIIVTFLFFVSFFVFFRILLIFFWLLVSWISDHHFWKELCYRV